MLQATHPRGFYVFDCGGNYGNRRRGKDVSECMRRGRMFLNIQWGECEFTINIQIKSDENGDVKYFSR